MYTLHGKRGGAKEGSHVHSVVSLDPQTWLSVTIHSLTKKDDSINEHAHNYTLNIRMPIHHIPPPLTHNYTFMHFYNSQYVCSLSSSGQVLV